MRYRIFIPGSGTTTHFIFILLITVLVATCNDNDQALLPTVTTNPTENDIIHAVRTSVEGSYYTETVWKQEMHTCNQIDVDLDPYMPRNPELAKCPSVGTIYYTDVSSTERRRCENLPDADTPGWSVIPTGDDQWRVLFAGRSWDVEKVDGGSVGAGNAVPVAQWTFVVSSHQAC